MNLAHIDELDGIEMPDGFVWRPVRKHFGIRAFGTNAYTPGESGQVVEEHTEEPLGHEEIYLVLRGRVRFTIGGDVHERGVGVDRLACPLGEFEANRMSGFPLADGRTIKDRPMRGNVLHLQADDVTASQVY